MFVIFRNCQFYVHEYGYSFYKATAIKKTAVTIT
jgi:hypothetical protein